MNLVLSMIFTFTLGLAALSIVRNTEWMKERNRKIYSWLCKKSGGVELEMPNAWTARCNYKEEKEIKMRRP